MVEVQKVSDYVVAHTCTLLKSSHQVNSYT